MELLEPSIILFLPIFGIISGIISAVSGGGGLLIMPLFMFLGLPPIQAIATMNLYSVLTHSTAISYFWRKRQLPHQTLTMVPIVMVVGGLGAYVVGQVPVHFLNIITPCLLILLALWAGFNPQLKPSEGKGPLSADAFMWGVLPILSFYDGFFGVSSTTFYTVAYLVLLNRSVIESTAVAKVFSASSSFAALMMFILYGHVVWSYGLFLSAGGIVGAYIGSHYVMKHGAVLVRWFVIGTSLAASLKLLCDITV